MIEKLDIEKTKIYVSRGTSQYNTGKAITMLFDKLNEIIDELNKMKGQ